MREVILRRVISVNQLSNLRSSGGRVCGDWPGRYPEASKGTEKPGAVENLENVDATRNVDRKSNFSDCCKSTGKPFCVNTSRGSQISLNMPIDQTLKTIEQGQFFMTLDDDQLDRLNGSCREYTLRRSDQSSQVKGWISGKPRSVSSGCDGLSSSRTSRC